MKHTANQKKQKYTALYCRLSRDDGTQDDSSSIQTQKTILSKYALDHGYRNTRFFVDDGYSGTTFHRPAFQEMIAEIEAGHVERVITKDLSRLGRNYLETGSYIEIFFPKHRVQYIAINDGVDSTSYQSMDITPFKNILNELYAADISKKIKSAKMARSQSGLYVGGIPPYGYKKDPDNHNQLVIDEDYAPVVRQIFQWAAEGMGIPTIRNLLRERKVLRPMAVSGSAAMKEHYGVNEGNCHEWSNNSVRQILRNPVYAGHMVAGRRPVVSMKTKARDYHPYDECIVAYNTHEGIVTQEQFDLVQRLITSRGKARHIDYKGPEFPNLFTGLVKCADCGCAMPMTKAHRPKRENPIDRYIYMCGTYKREGKGLSGCSQHKIEAHDLYDIVLEDIQRHAKQAVLDDEAFLSSLMDKMDSDRHEEQRQLAVNTRKAKQRLEELDQLYERLYEDRANGQISERNFTRLSAKYEQEQAELEQQIRDGEQRMHNAQTEYRNARQFVDTIRPYAEIQELDAPMLNTLIDHITVAEPEVVNGELEQKVTIYYNFIGSIQ